MALKITKKILKMSSQEVILGVVFVIYFILGYPVPEPLAEMLDSGAGKFVVVVIAIMLFLAVNPIIGVLGVLVALDLLRKSGEATGTTAMAKYSPSEQQKAQDLNKFNQFPYTLEQEMVSIRTLKQDVSPSPAAYKPVLENDHNASPVNAMDVI
jgi:hypothetical protein